MARVATLVLLGIATAPITRVRLAAAPPPLVVSEIYYHPAGETNANAAQARPRASRSEFVEIAATGDGDEALDLAGVHLEGAIAFTFADGTRLRPGERIVAIADRATFAARFGEHVEVAGVWEKRLANEGEVLRLVSADGTVLETVPFGARAPWPEEADGGGASLARCFVHRDADDPAAWTAASPSPGRANRCDDAKARLSVYRVKHEPAMPAPGEAVRISCRVAGAGATSVSKLEWNSSDGRRGELALAPSVDDSRDRTARLPAFSHATLVTYRITARDGAGTEASPPPLPGGVDSGAFWVERRIPAKIPVYSLVVDPEDVRRLEQNPYSNETVSAWFAHDGRTLPAHVRFRGQWARSWGKKSWKIILEPEARHRGVRRLNLNSCERDPSFLREALAYRVYREVGCPASRARMARLQVNGEVLGTYADIEHPRRPLLARWGLDDAVLYKAASPSNESDGRNLGSLERWSSHWEVETPDGADLAPLRTLCLELATARDVDEFFERRVDIDRFIAFLVAGAVTQNWDAFNKNHLIAIEHGGRGRAVFLPWDLDRTFGDHWHGGFDASSVPADLGTHHSPGPTGWNRFIDRFFSSEALRKRFLAALERALAETFTAEHLGPEIHALADGIRAEIPLDEKRWHRHSNWDGEVFALERWIEARRRFLLKALR